MSQPDAATHNAFAIDPTPEAKPAAVEAKPAPRPEFPGMGARIQNRPGQSLERMADRIHPTRKR